MVNTESAIYRHRCDDPLNPRTENRAEVDTIF
jgi:hypothetical protein